MCATIPMLRTRSILAMGNGLYIGPSRCVTIGAMLRATAALLLVMMSAATVVAQTKPDFEIAKRHYLAGKNAVAAGDYEAAIREYILAYDITKDPTLFKQIGGAYEAEGKKTEAAVYYRRYLAEMKNNADAEEVRGRLTALEGKAAERAKVTSPLPPRSGSEPPSPPQLPPPESPTQAPPEMKLSQPELPTYADEGFRWQRTAAWISVG